MVRWIEELVEELAEHHQSNCAFASGEHMSVPMHCPTGIWDKDTSAPRYNYAPRRLTHQQIFDHRAHDYQCSRQRVYTMTTSVPTYEKHVKFAKFTEC